MTINKKIIAFVLLLALIVTPLTGCFFKFAPAISKEKAIEILLDKIIPPAASDTRVSAFMPSEPLRAGDVVASESGRNYPINTKTWFIFIDDNPQAFFAHATRYVFIDAKTGGYKIANETWPPLINNFSLWDSKNLGRGYLIEVWSILDSATPIASSPTTAPKGDYGDAPDGQACYGVTGRFPTLFNTTNSQLGRPGGHTLNVGEEMLGLRVSAEVDAIDPNDPDGVPNLVDADKDERMYVIVDGKQAKLAFTVTVSPSAPAVTRYANALIDFDQNGKWNRGSYGVEWVVVNLKVNVAPGSSKTIITPLFSWGNKATFPSPVWMRVALTREKVDEKLFAKVGGWDGSGQFKYGEIEDHYVFLTDNPPPPPEPGPEPPPPPPPPPPGPKKGPCGYDINYYVLTISGGDCAEHLAKGTSIVQSSIDKITKAAGDQGYASVANLGPGNNSLASIGQAFDNLAKKVKCGDYVLVYICGHGYKNEDLKGGGIALKDSRGKTQEILKPTDLANILSKIKPCPDEDCTTLEKNCHLSLIIESCYAGNFNTPGVTGPGRSVTGTSTDTPSRATYPGGGVYTQGLDAGFKDPNADKSVPPDGVDLGEAQASAEKAVNKDSKEYKTGQKTWSSNQQCECKCPCKASVRLLKTWYLEASGKWVSEGSVSLGQAMRFKLYIENNGKCRNIVDISLTDSLPGGFEYGERAILYYGGKQYTKTPDTTKGEQGLQLTWNLKEITELAPGESVALEYDATPRQLGEGYNTAHVIAHCAIDYSVTVTDQAKTAVSVVPPPQILDAEIRVNTWSVKGDFGCDSFFDIYFEVQDLTGGKWPITSVVLYIAGMKQFDSGAITTMHYGNSVVKMPAGCGQTIAIELVIMNLNGETLNVPRSFTTPIPGE